MLRGLINWLLGENKPVIVIDKNSGVKMTKTDSAIIIEKNKGSEIQLLGWTRF